MLLLEEKAKYRAEVCKNVGDALAHRAWLMRLWSRLFLGIGAFLGILAALVQVYPVFGDFFAVLGGASMVATSAAIMLIIQTLVPLFVVDPPTRYEDYAEYILHKISLIDRTIAKDSNKTAKQEKLEHIIEITDKNIENVRKKWPKLYKKAVASMKHET